MQTSTAWAADLACELLQAPLPRRWAHVQGVAARARSIARTLGPDAELLEAAAWLHDIGYLPELAHTGLHQLDGARYLRDAEHANEMLCRMVAHHSCAHIEAEERGLAAVLRREFAPAPKTLADALTFCDMTTSPDGEHVRVDRRLAEIHDRYGEGHLVSRFIRRATPLILDAVGQVRMRGALTTVLLPQPRYGERRPARKWSRRSRIERSIWYSASSSRVTQRTWLLSSLAVGLPSTAWAVRTMENSCRASPLLV
jgi:putative nucleotidyltransferase with HDIG domain